MSYPDFDERLAEVRGRIAAAVARGGHGQAVTIVAVTKTHGPDAVEAAWAAGLRDVGENKVQEALDKQPAVTGEAASAVAGVRWHLIGHLQRNKVKHLGAFKLLHALDRPSLADAVHDFGTRRGSPMPVLVQVNVVGEETKGGYEQSMMETESERLRSLTGLRVAGVMAMAPFDVDEKTLRQVFSGARATQEQLRRAGHEADALSMGMSGDYEIAVEEGATIVRLGSVLFGARHV